MTLGQAEQKNIYHNNYNLDWDLERGHELSYPHQLQRHALCLILVASLQYGYHGEVN